MSAYTMQCVKTMKKCPECSYEGESKYCPECGALLEEVVSPEENICPNCGEAIDTPFCPNCGYGPEIMKNNEKNEMPALKPEKSRKKSLIIVILLLIIVTLSSYIVILKDDTGEESDYTVESADINQVANSGTEISGGKYVIGEDFPAGRYTFIYKTTMSEDDYWSNDYVWIIKSGSEGKNETLGGTKYDDRYGSVDYASATAGESFYIKLEDGDILTVDTGYGDWTY